MPRRPGGRRSADPLVDAQPNDDQADGAAILDEVPAVQGKRARWRKRCRSVLEIALNLLDGIGNLWPYCRRQITFAPLDVSPGVIIAGTGPVTGRLRVRGIDDDEGRRLVRIVRSDSGPVVTWRRAQTVLLPVQGLDVAGIARVVFTSEDRVRDVIHNFNADGFRSLYPKYKGGRPPKFTLAQRREINKIAKSRVKEECTTAQLN